MSRPRLLLITSRFPFSRGEEFLETEIHYLADAFDVVIVPWFPDTDLSVRRPVPAGVQVRADILQAFPVGWQAISAWLLRHPRALASLLELSLEEREALGMSPPLWRGEASYLLRALRLNQLLTDAFRDHSFDIAYSYWLSPAALAVALLKESGLTKISVARGHGGDVFHERSLLGYLPSQALAVNRLDSIYGVATIVQRYLQQRYPQHQDKFEVTRLGVRPAPARNVPSSDGRLHLVSCAYMVPVKRLHLLVDALTHCEFPIHWTHLGGGGLEPELRARAANLPPHITWEITGPLPNAEILRFYQEHPVDLFVSVSASEGLPVSMMEAMSYGIPIAATAVGGVPELVEPGRNGYLWDASVSPLVIADTLRDFYHLPQDAKLAMRDASWQIWRERVNAEVQYPDFTRRLLALLDT